MSFWSLIYLKHYVYYFSYLLLLCAVLLSPECFEWNFKRTQYSFGSNISRHRWSDYASWKLINVQSIFTFLLQQHGRVNPYSNPSAEPEQCRQGDCLLTTQLATPLIYNSLPMLSPDPRLPSLLNGLAINHQTGDTMTRIQGYHSSRYQTALKVA